MDELIRKTLSGDSQSWEELWERTEPMVWALTGRGRLTGRISQRRDHRRQVVEAVRAKLQADELGALRRFHEAAAERSKPSSYRAWLATITTRAALDHAGAHSRRRPGAAGTTAESDAPHSTSRARALVPKNLAAAVEMLGGARRTLPKVPSEEVAALHLWLQGGSFADVAEELQLSAAPEGGKLVRSALGKLRAELLARDQEARGEDEDSES